MLQFPAMLAVIPLLHLVVLGIFIVDREPQTGWRHAFLRASLLAGVYAILSLEVLSLIHAVTQVGLAVAWSLPLVVMGVLLVRRWRADTMHLPTLPRDLRWHEWLLASLILAALAVTLVVALIAPPQTYDSLNYHLPRVAHWWQDRSIAFFATGIEKQNIYPPGAEFLVLHLYTLEAGDHLVNLVSWFAYLGSGLAASLISARLGTKRAGQLFAAAFVYATPMAIAQSSSTMNDIVAGFWLLCAALETTELWKNPRDRFATWMAGLAAGLAVLTKPTILPYLATLGILHFILLITRCGWKTLLTRALPALAALILINAGFWSRSVSIYGNLTDSGTVSTFASSLDRPAMILSNVLRNAGLQTWTPWPKVNDFLYTTIYKVHVKLGLALDDPATTYGGTFQVRLPSWSEDLISNPLAAALCLAAMLLVFLWVKRDGFAPGVYALAIVLGFLLYSGLFKWQIFAGRLMLPLFLAFAPICGYVLGKIRPPALTSLSGTLVLVLAWPALTGIASRPLVPIPGSSLTGSILTTTREELRFANIQAQQPTNLEIVKRIQAAGCSQVGLALQGDGAEYPFWTLLGAPDHRLQLAWVVAGTPSAQLSDPDFHPCAMICTTCTESQYNALPLVLDRQGFRLYLQTNP